MSTRSTSSPTLSMDSSDLYLRLDRSGTILNWDGAGLEDGQDLALLGRKIHSLLPAQVVPGFLQGLGRVVDEQVTSSIEYMLPVQDSEHYYEARLYPYSDEQVVTIISDVTERRRAERDLLRAHAELELIVQERTSALRTAYAELAKAEERYRSVFENAVEGIYCATPGGELLEVNPALARMLGYPGPAELVKEVRSVAVLRQDPEVDARFSEQMANAGMVAGFEYRIRRKNGSILWLTENARLVLDADGSPQRLDGMIMDVTSRREKELAEEQRAKAELASRAKSEFLAHVSHEMRTPLHVLTGLTEVFEKTRMDAEQQRYLRLFRSSQELLVELVDDLLDFSRIGAGKVISRKQPFSLRDLLDDLAEHSAERFHKKGIEFVCRSAAGVPDLVAGDPVLLRKILISLLGNAAKFTHQGQVVLDVAPAERTGWTRIAVRDTGPGIAAEKQELIFESFVQADDSTTRRFGGAGLGLTIARRLTELLGGSLRLDSRPGEGSSFMVELPLSPASGSQPAEPDLSGIRVLVIEDNRAAAEELCTRLVRFGAVVGVAGSAEEGLLWVREASDRGERLGLVLVDRGLPDMDGYDLVRRIWSTHPSAVRELVLMTQERAPGPSPFSDMLPGLSGYLRKPVLHRDLTRTAFSLITAAGSPCLASGPNSGWGRHVLVVDDCANSRMLLEFFLKCHGSTFEHATTGVDAVRKFEQGRFDLVIMDLHLPAMDGFAATRAIRRFERERNRLETPVLAITAAESWEEEARSLEAGCSAFLSKPFRREALIHLLDRFAAVTSAGDEVGKATLGD